jgi:hypothetical protein
MMVERQVCEVRGIMGFAPQHPSTKAEKESLRAMKHVLNFCRMKGDKCGWIITLGGRDADAMDELKFGHRYAVRIFDLDAE